MSFWCASLVLISLGQSPGEPPKSSDVAPSATVNSEGEQPKSAADVSPTVSQFSVVRRDFEGMGTQIFMLAYTENESEAREAMQVAFTEMLQVSRAMSEWSADSWVSAVNENAGGQAVVVDKDFAAFFERVRLVSNESSGAFAQSWAALGGLWDFGAGESSALPDEGALAAKLPLVGDDLIEWDAESRALRLPQAGMAMGTSAALRGYLLERAVSTLSDKGFSNVLVFVGGDIKASGTKGEEMWRVGLQDPRGESYFALLPLSGEVAATSGDYFEYFELAGKRYHSVLDPRTGYPARGLRSATVISKDGVLADAFATAIFVMGPERGFSFAEKKEGLEAILITQDNEILVTSGLKDRLKLIAEPTP